MATWTWLLEACKLETLASRLQWDCNTQDLQPCLGIPQLPANCAMCVTRAAAGSNVDFPFLCRDTVMVLDGAQEPDISCNGAPSSTAGSSDAEKDQSSTVHPFNKCTAVSICLPACKDAVTKHIRLAKCTSCLTPHLVLILCWCQ